MSFPIPFERSALPRQAGGPLAAGALGRFPEAQRIMNRTFASDNNAPVAPEIIRALEAANDGDAVGYGRDSWTQTAIERFREVFGEQTDVYFAFNGTGANVLALGSVLKPYEAVLCAATAHLYVDECGALERVAGCKTIAIATSDGKLRPADVAPHVGKGRDEHHVQPRVVSISQATEYGSLYSNEEIGALCAFAHEHGLIVHVDGARISNAAAALGATPKTCTKDRGVDILTFGGTKNGLMFGEAVLFFDAALHDGAAAFSRKQTTQLASKMRYISAQFSALLEEDRWHSYAAHANAMTARLAERVNLLSAVEITQPVQTNAIFATLDRAAVERLQREFFFYCFDEARPEVRWMTHWATRPQDVDAFADALERCVS